MGISPEHFSRCSLGSVRLRHPALPQLQPFTIRQQGEGTRPGIEGPDLVVKLRCRLRPVQFLHVPGDQRGIGSLCFRLGNRFDGPVHDFGNGFQQQVCALFLQDIVEFSLAHFRPDGDCHFAEHGAGVHAHIHLHDGDTRFLFAFQDGIVDRGRSPIPGQQRSMDVDAAIFGQVQQALGKELPESCHYNQLGLDFLHLRLEFRGLHPLGLQHGQIPAEGVFLYRTHLYLVAPAFGTIGLGHHRSDFILSGFHQRFQAGRSEFRRSHEYDSHLSSSFGLAVRLMALSMNRIPSR